MNAYSSFICFFFFQAEDGIRDLTVTGVQTCALPILDGAVQNRVTLTALRALQSYVNARKLRRLEIVPKLQRGGRVSSLNQGLALASGEIVMALDGDTSFDNDMVRHAVRHFADANVVAGDRKSVV